MKVILKGGSKSANNIIEDFFMENILPILKEIAIESTNRIIVVYEKKDDSPLKTDLDPTAEVIVELTEEARNLAIDINTPEDVLKQKSGDFFDEALAIRMIEKLKPPFSREYYSCRYTPSSN